MNRMIASLMVAAAFVPGAALADEGRGFYGSLEAGVNAVSDVPVTIYDADGTFGVANGTKDTVEGSYDLKSAAMFGGTLGYDFGTVRADLQIAYARNSIRAVSLAKVNGTAVTLTGADATDFCDYIEYTNCTLSGTNTVNFASGPKLRQLSAMANLWFDIPMGGKVEPYIGGGLGVAGFEVDGEGKGKFAWQIGAGVAFKLSDSIALTADFRHRQVSKVDVAYDAVSGYQLGKIKTTSYGLGLRVGF